ncbi:ShlB/FhaC/HecB family hemolysin secretion/activation protein [Rhodocyclus tenuis]|nr:ShlB/FhaC/HecB family hemolysin secretion/activation protein [Rhodocyclus gracilis]
MGNHGPRRMVLLDQKTSARTTFGECRPTGAVTVDRHNPFAMQRLSPPLFLLPAFIVCGATLASINSAAGFELLEFSVEGNSVLPDIEIERAVYPSLGPGKTLADIEKARAALEAAYQDAGYLSVSVVVPEQSIDEGQVRLLVVDGRVDALKVSGNRFTSRSELRSEVPELAHGTVPHFPTMQAQLAQAGRSPDRRVTPLLRPGSRPGTMEVELAVEDDLPLHGNIEVNNRQSPDTSGRRIEAGVHYDNLFQRQHSAGFNYVLTPENPDQVNVLSAFYSAPIGGGRSLSAFVQHSNSNIATAGDSSVIGKGTTLGARLSLTLPNPPGTSGLFHSLSLGIDYKDLQETQNILGADQKVSPLRYSPLMAQYTLNSLGDAGEFLANIGLAVNLNTSTQRINCQGYDTDQFACRRYGARPGFSVLRGDLGYTHRLFGWEWSARADFQASAQPLVSGEQILAGGMDSVRGYYEGEAAGDRGWRLRSELKTPSLADIGNTRLRAAGFLEGAKLSLNDPLPGQTAEFSLASAGIGLRLKGDKAGPLVALDLAQALKAGPRTARGDKRLHVRIGYEF